MTDEVRVRHLDGDRFAIDVRGHTLLVDQPAEAGGTDTAPTPTELFIAGLASCVAFYARRYAARHMFLSGRAGRRGELRTRWPTSSGEPDRHRRHATH